MPPPPAQKGKFRPKKPPRRRDAPTPAAPDAAPSSAPTVEFAPSTFAGRGHGGRDGRGSGGRGSGGRGPRRRAPIPSGRTFFTAGEKPAATKKKRGLDKFNKNKDDDPTEEIVDILDVPIGPSKAKDAPKRSVLESMDRMEYDDQNGDDGGASSYVVDGAMYSDDSSQEEGMGRQKTSKMIQPLQLPFPIAPLPVGIGETDRKISYEVPDAGREAHDEFQGQKENAAAMTGSSASPFVDINRGKDVLWEQNNWFLVQLPTRLPTLKQKSDPSADDGDDNEETPKDEIVGDESIAEVATKPLVANSFDNTLSRAAPGRIGKIKVYKSGKTVLVMDSPDGSEEVRLNVHEGLTCGFLQQAVAVDLERSHCIGLGDVTKSVVMSPDLESAFNAH